MPARRTVFKAISIAVVAILAGIAIYVYKVSVGKFEVRRLSLPTRIYADYTPLQAGTIIASDDLLEKLARLGYREVDSVSQSGDFATKRGEVYVFTRQFAHPTGEYQSQPIRIVFNHGTIEAITSLRDGHPIDKAALEPELLTSIL